MRPKDIEIADGFGISWLPLLIGVASHAILAIFCGMMRVETLEELYHSHWVFHILCWIPVICYIFAIGAVLIAGNAKCMAAMGLVMLICIPLLTTLGVAGFWAFIAGAVALGIVVALGLGAPLLALIAIITVPGLIVAAFAAIAAVAFLFLDSVMLFF